VENKIVHCKKDKYDIYIGRPSYYGNPFTIGKDGDREKVIQKYIEYFYKRISSDKIFKFRIKNLKDKILGCWCAPLKCHGDIIIEWLNKND